MHTMQEQLAHWDETHHRFQAALARLEQAKGPNDHPLGLELGVEVERPRTESEAALEKVKATFDALAAAAPIT